MIGTLVFPINLRGQDEVAMAGISEIAIPIIISTATTIAARTVTATSC